MNLIQIKTCLISVSDKTGIVDLAKFLQQHNVKILSTGGTFKLLQQHLINAQEVADFTGCAEMLDGRVKTLHPKIHGGLLAINDDPIHQQQSKQHNIESIDLLIVNLYPFIETVATTSQEDLIIENIDIGGPAMIRSAAKNFAYKTVITSSKQYQLLQEQLINNNFATTLDFRRFLASQAFANIANYDVAIAQWFTGDLNIYAQHKKQLRYGENSHQQANIYSDYSLFGIANATILQGKELSYNNYNDADAAFMLVNEFNRPACAIIKHSNPCGVAIGNNICDAFNKAFAADAKSAYGGIVAVNGNIDLATAKAISAIFFEVIIAPSIDEDAKILLSAKKNLRILLANYRQTNSIQLKSISGGFLAQSPDNALPAISDLTCMSVKKLTTAQLEQLLFAFTVCKHTKSNAIVVANNYQTYGLGIGQTNRVDACQIACEKAKNMFTKDFSGAFLASDAFFPFADNIEIAGNYQISGIIAPAGSIRDNEVIARANELGIALYFTNTRHFRH
jgi:phosphoribosylaminoimidazolecarboxamide formyltransferase/IMP cyclohydrolase